MFAYKYLRVRQTSRKCAETLGYQAGNRWRWTWKRTTKSVLQGLRRSSWWSWRSGLLHGSIEEKEDNGRETSPYWRGNLAMEQIAIPTVSDIPYTVYFTDILYNLSSDLCFGWRTTWKKEVSRAVMPTPIQWRSLWHDPVRRCKNPKPAWGHCLTRWWSRPRKPPGKRHGSPGSSLLTRSGT